MKIATGHPISNDLTVLDVDEVSFLSEDGRCIFQVSKGENGRSITITGVSVYVVDDVIYTEALEIRPRYTNSVEIRTVPYGPKTQLDE